ncbi:MAG: DSBA oxidoreductase [Candidatus Roizmanbacteria bacterium GW2011_GWA2_34_18]|uniref:DSBA oxidoreductase n=1 Tax=Candidatus Roizmanbacteria bacterium GW2011_GWA2_34_18 TaxID=1618477 RepID=A0A0G0AVX1_9BACT|nr:MAG: DSBA oxidoreductase [Candidatus Roizmanbacteria bacterium GW2011_GWA2_34_18]
MNKNIIVISIVSVLGTFLLLFGVYKLINQPIQTDFPQTKQLKTNDHIKWSFLKKNILIEYSDFQCPACKNAHNILKTIEASGSADFSITEKVTFVYRHFPLFQIHDKANAAAYAAEAAGKQDKFWEMGDLLFDNQQAWEKSNDPQKEYFLNYAKELQLDVDRFKKDSDSSEVKNRVAEDLKDADQMGINSTPTFFLNGQKVNVNSFDEFKVMLKKL